MSTQGWAEFTEQVNDARLARHLSISEAARLAGVPKSTAQGWLNGRHRPTPALRSQYMALIDHLGLGASVPVGLWPEQWDRIEPQLRTERAPYLGLRHFAVADTDLYFGRTHESRRLAEQVVALRASAGSGVVAVIGPSGSGKSSLIAAGLVGREASGGGLAGWRIESVAPGDLARCTSAADLVIVDQFEDVLRLPPEELDEAMAVLARLSRSRIVLVALRSDAFAEAEAEPALVDALGRAFLITPLTRAELRDVITGPAALAGVQVESELVGELLDELAPGSSRSVVAPEILPLLSTALLVTWASGEGERMALADYRRAGGVGGAVELLAERVFSELDAEEQEAAQLLFVRMVGMRDGVHTRLSLPLGDFDEASRRVVDAFVPARMLTVDHDRVQISHDVLLRHWTRLAGWLDDHADAMLARERLRRAAEVWAETDRDSEALIPVERFGPAITDVSLLGPAEREFVTASREHFASELEAERQTSRRLRNQRRLALGLAVVTTVAAVGVAVGFVRSESYREDAVAARNEAQSRQIATAARDLRSKSPNLEAQLALVARQLADTQEARSAVMDAASVDVPIRWLGRADATIAVSPDGKLVARADGSGSVTLWRGTEVTGSQGTTFFTGSTGALRSVALTEVGGRSVLAVAGEDVRSLWDVTGSPVRIADVAPGGATAVAFDPGAGRVAFGDASGGATVYDITALEQPREVAHVHPSGADVQTYAVALDRAGRLYVAGARGEVDRWLISATPHELQPLTVTVAGPDGRLPVRAQALALSPDGTRLAAGLAGNEVARWRIGSGGDAQAEPPLTGFSDFINGVVFSRDGASIAVAGSDQSVTIYSAADGSLQRRMYGPSVQTSVGFTDSGRPVSAGNDGTLLVWPQYSPLWKLSGAVIYNLSTEESGWLAGGSSVDGIALWRLGETPQRMPTPVPPQLARDDYQVGAVAVAPNGRFLLGSSMKGQVLSWPLTGSGAGTGRAFDSGFGLSVIFTVVSPDSSLVAAMSARASKVALFRADATGGLTLLATLPTSDPQLVGFNADGGVLAVAQANRTVSLWSVRDPVRPVQIGAISGLASVPTIIDMAPKSTRIAVGESSGEVTLWDIARPDAPAKLRSWTDASSDIYSLEFSPDESQLIGTSGDDVVWGWRLDSAATQADFALDGDIGRPWDVRFFNDGRSFAGSGDLGAVRVWDGDPALAAADLCSRIGDQLTTEEWHRYLPGVESRPVC